MNIQATYRENVFSNKEEMDKAVDSHIYYNADNLPVSNRKVLRSIAGHAFNPIGTAHLKIETIANEVGCSQSTVNRAIKRLVELKVIHVKKGTKGNGIQGANYYSILNFSHVMTERVQEREMTERATHETPRSSKVEHVISETETRTSFNQSLNPFVVKNVVNNVNACVMHNDLKSQLRDIYNPQSVEGNKAFDELCKIAFGRLKQFMKSHNMPYLQMEQIVLNCMRALVNKQGVRNQFAMYSKMIERQTLQLFEKFIHPVQAVKQQSRELVPEWFEKRNEPSTVDVDKAVDFEAERQKILAKIGG